MIDLKTYKEKLEGKPVAVFGLGSSGMSVVKALCRSGIKVIAWDDYEDAQEKGLKEGADIKKLTSEVLKKCGNLIVSPGIPLSFPEPHEIIIAAQEAGCPVTGDIELFAYAQPKCRTLALTGTNGKSTTVTLMKHVLDNCKIKAALGGNIGYPILETKDPGKDGVTVLELSSFQLDLIEEFTPDIAVILNITPDHIDRHGSMENYALSKQRIFRGSGQAVICIDDDYTSAMYKELLEKGDRTMIPVSVTQTLERGVYVENGRLIDNTGKDTIEVGSLNGITKLNGTHNHQNAAAAYAALTLLGLERDCIMEGFRSYPGLAHRQFPVRTINGVAYVNDSKATNAEATSKALAHYRNIYWIVGGRGKEGGLRGLGRYTDNITHAYLIGETANEYAQWLEKHGIGYEISHTLDIAVKHAHEEAQKSRGKPGASGVVLLSPACASYDQFKSFEHRGDVFAELVNALPEEVE